jgi:plasmid replication initiation protein
MKEKDKEVVRYNNDLNNKTYLKNFNALELNFFMAICSKLKTQGTDEVIFSFKELKKKIQYDRETTRNTDNFISKLRSTNRKILNSICEIETKDYIDQFVLFPTFRISKKTGTLTVRINQDYAYLLNDFSNFTEFGLANFIKLSSKYVKLLYRELMQFKSTGKLYLTMEDFRKKLDIPDSYSFSKIKNRILVPSIQDFSFIFKKFKIVVIYNNEDEIEINENTEEKRGDKRKVTNINFYFVLGTKEDIIEVPVPKEILKDKLEANTNEEIDIKEEERLFNLEMNKNKLEFDNDMAENEIEVERKKIEKYKEYIRKTKKLNSDKEYIDPVDDSINRDIINHYEASVAEAEEKIKKLEAEIIENKKEIEKLENEIGCNHSVINQATNGDKKDIEAKEEIDYLKLIKEFLKGQDIDYKKVETNINFLLENYTSEEIYREIIRINNIKNEKANIDPKKYLITSINNIEKIKNDCKQDESIKTSYINTDNTDEAEENKGLINYFELF